MTVVVVLGRMDRPVGQDHGVSLEDHASHLIVHGLLHLAGYDHEISPADADEMEALEIKALAKLSIADPYGDRDS